MGESQGGVRQDGGVQAEHGPHAGCGFQAKREGSMEGGSEGEGCSYCMCAEAGCAGSERQGEAGSGRSLCCLH